MDSQKTEVPVTERPVDESSPTSSTRGQELNENKSLFERATSLFEEWYYVWEVFGILISGLAIIAICMVVFRFDGNQVPKWEAKVPYRKETFRLTINSLLSMLSVLGSTCAMIPVTKSLGQLKYLWFMEQDRKLADLEVFDSASRGKFGSAMLIWKLRFKHLAVLGGLASLLALAYGPFVQNLLTFSIQYKNAGHDAILSYAWAYAGTGQSVEITESSFKYKIVEALEDASVDWAVPALRCKTGDCYWNPYYTIAACSRCTDISHLLTRTCTPVVTSQDGPNEIESGGCNVALPNGLSLNSTGATNPHRVVMLMNTTMSPLASNYSSPLALVQSIAGYPSEGSTLSEPFMITNDSPLSAHECALIPCVQRQNLVIHREGDDSSGDLLRSNNGVVPSINITEQWDKYYTDPSGGWVSITFDDPSVNKNIGDQPYDGTPYMDMAAYNALKKYLEETLSGYVYTDPTDTDPKSYLPSGGTARTIYSHTVNRTWTPPYCDGSGTTAKQTGVVCGMNKTAAGLTNAFRLQTWQIADSPSRLNGTTRAPQQMCKAQWQYVSAPIAVWALGLVLFIGVVIKTRRANIKAWRTSPLATLLLRLDPDSREHLKDWQNMGDAELKDAAKELRLRLQMDESGPRFVRRTGGPPS
ncbi:hypothetical protein CGRA01v4_13083 [Colletotrichum graminicola]|uniref:Uncharacterized protein n=1 Tax=Colletotrichum graminicola (strain M1.001 / M2 / FGSC 10212) TaxID=645133 RepID=E3QM24_COLGM|nr:uncharacterized protein GLRG_07056 [Colletotrichum graminicola M1.001]EFQ31912.1 hypothetical protein GLRG_07056 [Colletotrichum graminicola M1.001]WDK21793.1 hypothetical protein CGRA01v4_13083 [Colletotrichum graminicola]